jgi:hypothetical protein
MYSINFCLNSNFEHDTPGWQVELKCPKINSSQMRFRRKQQKSERRTMQIMKTLNSLTPFIESKILFQCII